VTNVLVHETIDKATVLFVNVFSKPSRLHKQLTHTQAIIEAVYRIAAR